LPNITLDEVNKYAKSLVSNENKVILVSAPDKPEIKVPTEKEVLDLYNKVAAAQHEAYKDDAVDKPLMAKLPKPGKITSEKNTGKFDIIEMKLSNGARVLVKKTDFKNDEVLFRAWSPGGTSLAKMKISYQQCLPMKLLTKVVFLNSLQHSSKKFLQENL